MSQKWEYNGVTLEVDLQDADFAEKYETAFNKLAEEEKQLQKEGTTSSVIRKYCKMFFDLFDTIYGPGTSEKLFCGNMNAALVDDAYSCFIDAAKRCNAEAVQRRNEFKSKYAPQLNREQRRYHNKHRSKRS